MTQNNFFLMSTFHCGVDFPGFKFLTERRVKFDVIIISNILNGDIDALKLLSQISLTVPNYCSKNSLIFRTKFHPADYGHAIIPDRVYRKVNNLSDIR